MTGKAQFSTADGMYGNRPKPRTSPVLGNISTGVHRHPAAPPTVADHLAPGGACLHPQCRPLLVEWADPVQTLHVDLDAAGQRLTGR